MDVGYVIQYWLATAQADLRAAEHLFRAGDYVHVLFLGYLYLEKTIRAVVVRHTGEHAARNATLEELAQIAELDLTLAQWGFLNRVTEYYAKTKYPDLSLNFQNQCTREFCAVEFKQIRDFGIWLAQVAGSPAAP